MDRAACSPESTRLARGPAEKIRERKSGQGNLFEALGDAADASAPSWADDLPDAPPLSDQEKLASEHDLLGIYISGHPLDRFRTLMRDFQTFTLASLDAAPEGRDVRVAGLATTVQRRISQKTKEPWAIIQLHDGEQTVEVLAFSETFRAYEGVCRENQPLLVCGQVKKRDNQNQVVAREIYRLTEAPDAFADTVMTLVRVGADTEQRMERLQALARAHPGPVPLLVCLRYPAGHKVVIEADPKAAGVAPTAAFVGEAEELLGRRSVRFNARAMS